MLYKAMEMNRFGGYAQHWNCLVKICNATERLGQWRNNGKGRFEWEELK